MRLKGSMPQMKALILAGGKGKRLGSDITHIPKVMRKANGKPLLGYVMEYTDFIDKKDKVILVGYEKEKVISAFPEYPFAVQEVQKGTGHAVMCAKECFEGYEGEVLVINGDMPLLRRESVLELIKAHKENGNLCTILSFVEKGEIPKNIVKIWTWACVRYFKDIVVPDTVVAFAENAFLILGGNKLKVKKDSPAHKYAVENNMNYEII
jgi:molybdopterin-guanine dinucleotide biosynthesis protein A